MKHTRSQKAWAHFMGDLATSHPNNVNLLAWIANWAEHHPYEPFLSQLQVYVTAGILTGQPKLKNLLNTVSVLLEQEKLKTFGSPILEFQLSTRNLRVVPASIGNLSQLQTLDLRENKLTALPETLGQLKQLQTLDLRNKQLTTLPETLTSWLEDLERQGCTIDGRP